MATISISMNLDVDLEEWARVRNLSKPDGSLDLKAAEQDLTDSLVYLVQEELYKEGILIED